MVMTVYVHDKKARPLPINGRRKLRFAVGTPNGQTSNSWLIDTGKKGDIYVICRDNFSDSKVSLHASGKWRYAFSDSLAKDRPDLVPPGSDRAQLKWNPPDGWKKQPIVAFELHVPQSGLYLAPSNRNNWKSDVIFIEPHRNPHLMTVVQLVVAPVGMRFDRDTAEGGTIAALQLTNELHVMIDVIFQEAALHNEKINNLIGHINTSEEIRNIASRKPLSVTLIHGLNNLGTMYFMSLPLRKLLFKSSS